MAVAATQKSLTSAQVADLLGLTEQAFRRKRMNGDDLPEPYYLGRFVRYQPSVVQAWIDAHQGRQAIKKRRCKKDAR
jgi:predicted DNA-binding transcriptional regulator AlpA